MVWAVWRGITGSRGPWGPKGDSPPGRAPPPVWAGCSAAYQPQNSMTQSCSDLLPSQPSPPRPTLDPVSTSSLSGWD